MTCLLGMIYVYPLALRAVVSFLVLKHNAARPIRAAVDGREAVRLNSCAVRGAWIALVGRKAILREHPLRAVKGHHRVADGLCEERRGPDRMRRRVTLRYGDGGSETCGGGGCGGYMYWGGASRGKRGAP